MSIEGTVFGGRWRVLQALSSGGMGAVYVAEHADTGRKVALKIIRDEGASSPELVARFRKETGALAAVSHPNVVTFLDSGVESGTFFLVMELLDGRSLRSVMGTALDWKRAFRIAADACRGLAAVHKLGIVHRDLKPENIFLQDAEGHDEIAKLIDFGIVRLHDRQTAAKTQTGSVVGTPGYIAPEQLQGKDASSASDVYAVGVILYELVTGTFPFEAPTPHAMLVRQLMEPLIPPRSALSTVPAHVEKVILQFMERDPAKRVGTAKEALAVLVEALKFTESLPPTAPTETENDLLAVAAQVAQAGAAPSTSVVATANLPAPVPTPSSAPSAAVVTRGTAPTGTVIPPSAASPGAEPKRKRSAGEKLVLVAGLLTLGMLGTCTTCVFGAVASKCGKSDDDVNAIESPSAPPAPDVKPPSLDDTIRRSATITERPDGKKDIGVKIGGANFKIEGVDGIPSLPAAQKPDEDDDEDVRRKPPSANEVRGLIKAEAEALRECGGLGPKPVKLQVTLSPDGEFHLDTPQVGPALACAAGIIDSIDGPEFRGKAVTVTVPLALGR